VGEAEPGPVVLCGEGGGPRGEGKVSGRWEACTGLLLCWEGRRRLSSSSSSSSRGEEEEEEKEGRGAEEMATGEITTLPSSPDDGGSGGFLHANFREPKKLYCKNGGFFLRIGADGRVDGVRDKTHPHSKSCRHTAR